MRALVTGGAGFIGSNIVDALLARGDSVAVLDDLSTGREDEPRRGARRRAPSCIAPTSATRPRSRRRSPRRSPSVVFHLAAQIDVRRSLDDPAFDASVNVVGTINVLEAARRHGVQRLVNTSTGGAIYGETDVMPTPETVPPAPTSAYGQSKQCAEQYCAWAERLHGLPTVTLRYGNVYGPRQDPSGEAGVIAIFAGRLLDGGRPTIFGDGTAIRDYTYVVGHRRPRTSPPPATRQRAAPTTSARAWSPRCSTSCRRCATRPAREDGDFEPEFEPARLGELDRSSLDVSRARDELGYVAGTTLVEGMRATIEHLRLSRGG